MVKRTRTSWMMKNHDPKQNEQTKSNKKKIFSNYWRCERWSEVTTSKNATRTCKNPIIHSSIAMNLCAAAADPTISHSEHKLKNKIPLCVWVCAAVDASYKNQFLYLENECWTLRSLLLLLFCSILLLSILHGDCICCPFLMNFIGSRTNDSQLITTCAVRKKRENEKQIDRSVYRVHTYWQWVFLLKEAPIQWSLKIGLIKQ